MQCDREFPVRKLFNYNDTMRVWEEFFVLSEIMCENCGHPIDDCKCVCPYCGESAGCECCIGARAVTGG